MGPEEMRFEEMRFSQKVHAERRKKQGATCSLERDFTVLTTLQTI